MMKTRTVPVTSKMEFHKDPFFSDCWNVAEKEHLKAFQERTLSGGFYRQTLNPDTSPTGGNIHPSKFEKSSEIESYKSCYKVFLDVQGFRSEDLKVSVTDRTITIDGTHTEVEDHSGSVSRSFTRHFVFPTDALMDVMNCSLSSDGVLHISTPKTCVNDQGPMVWELDSIANLKLSDDSDKSEVIEANDNPALDSRARNLHSYMALPNFDLVPFWGRETPNNSPFGIKSDKENFKIVLDTRSFCPGEVDVFCTPHCVIVEGEHVEKEDEHGRIARKFTRKYLIPRRVVSQDFRCFRRNDGVLEIMAPWQKIKIDDEILVRLAIENKDEHGLLLE